MFSAPKLTISRVIDIARLEARVRFAGVLRAAATRSAGAYLLDVANVVERGGNPFCATYGQNICVFYLAGLTLDIPATRCNAIIDETERYCGFRGI